MPEDRWEFDESVTDAFEDMLARSIPQYDVMRRAVRDVILDRLNRDPDPHPKGTRNFLDLGTSRGDALAEILEAFPLENYLAIEVSPPMLDAARRRFAGWPNVNVRNLDLREEFPSGTFDATLSILTLQFVPINYRQRIVRDVYRSLRPGGVFVCVEKILGAGELDETFVDIYHTLKAENGYTGEQIERKRLALEGVLVPMTDRWNREMLYDAGFRTVDSFWRWMNFTGYVAIRD